MCHLIQISKLALPYSMNYNQAQVQTEITAKFINHNADTQSDKVNNRNTRTKCFVDIRAMPLGMKPLNNSH